MIETLTLISVIDPCFVHFLFISRYRRVLQTSWSYTEKWDQGWNGFISQMHHSGAAFIWPIIQAYRYMDLHQCPSVDLETPW